MSTAAANNAEKSRYELVSDGRVVSIAEYQLTGNTVVFTHTETVEELRGQGRAGGARRDRRYGRLLGQHAADLGGDRAQQ